MDIVIESEAYDRYQYLTIRFQNIAPGIEDYSTNLAVNNPDIHNGIISEDMQSTLAEIAAGRLLQNVTNHYRRPVHRDLEQVLAAQIRRGPRRHIPAQVVELVEPPPYGGPPPQFAPVFHLPMGVENIGVRDPIPYNGFLDDPVNER